MPDNNLQNLMNTYIMPMALPILRENCMMPALVSQDYNQGAFSKNAVVRVPLPQDLGPAQDFDPHFGSDSTALSDPKIDLTLDKWKYKQFEMNDLEMRETITSAILPSAAESSLKSIANAIDLDLIALYKDIPYVAGTPGLAVSTDTLIDARRVMNENLAPPSPRYALWNTVSESDLLKSIKVWNQTGPVSTDALRHANMGTLIGFDAFVDQLMLQHVPGTATGDVLTVAVNVPAGATSMPLSGSTAQKTILKGDVFTMAGVMDRYGHPKPFVVTADISAVNGSFGSVAISPALPVDVAATTALTFLVPAGGKSFINQSLAFHRDAFMIAMRTLSDEQSENSTISVAVDPVSGIPLRLETWRDPKFAKRLWRFDVLYGVRTIRDIFACRING